MADGEGGFVVKADPDAASTARVSSEDASTASWSQIRDWLIDPALGDPQSVQTASDHAGTIKRSLSEAMRRLVDVYEISQQKIKGRTSEAFEAAVAGFHSTIAASYDAMVGMPTGLGDYQYVLGDLARAYQYGRNEAEWIMDFYARQAVDVFGAQSSVQGGQTVVDVTTTLDPAKGQQILALMTADLQFVMRQVDEAYRHRTSSLTQPGAPVQTPVSPQSTTSSIPGGGGGGALPRSLGAGGAGGGGISPVGRGSGDLPIGDSLGGPDRSAVPLPTPVGTTPGRLPGLDPSTPGGGSGGIPSPAPLTPLPIASGAGGAGLSPSRSPGTGTDSGAGVVGAGSGTGLGTGAVGTPAVAPLAIGGATPRAADRAGLGGPALGGRSGASGAGGVAASGLGSGVPLAVPLSPSATAARGGAVPSVTASGAGSGAGGLPFAPMGAGGAGGAGAGGAAARRARGGATSAFPGVGGATLRPAAAVPGSTVPTALTVGTTPVARAADAAGGGGGSGMPFMPMGGGSGGAAAGAGGNTRSRRPGAELQPFPGLAVDPTLRPAPPLVASSPPPATSDGTDATAAPDPAPASPSAAGARPAPMPDAERVTVAPPFAAGPPVAFLAGPLPGAGAAAAGAGPAPVSGATPASRAAPGGTGTASAPITGPPAPAPVPVPVPVPVPEDAPVPALPAGRLDTGANAGGPPSPADGAAGGLLVPLGPLRPRKRAERRRAAAELTGDVDRADSTGGPWVIEIPAPGTAPPDGPGPDAADPDAADPDGSGPGGPGPDGVAFDGGLPGIGGPDAGDGDARA